MERKEYIQKNIENHLKNFQERYPNLEYFAIVLQGSQNYNLDLYSDNYKSDIDTKIIIIPNFKDIVLNKPPISTTCILDNNEHIDIKDIRLMFNNFLKQNINFLEILFSEFYIVNPKYKQLWEKLREANEEIAHYDMKRGLKCMMGMAMEKRKALCHEYPSIKSKIEKYGYDGKQLHHIIRMNNFMDAYVRGFTYKECLCYYPDLEILMKSKLNEIPYEDAIRYADFYLNEIKTIKEDIIDMIQVDENDKRKVEELLYTIQYQAIKQKFREEDKENE